MECAKWPKPSSTFYGRRKPNELTRNSACVPVDKAVAEEVKKDYPNVEDLWTMEYLGGWKKVTEEIYGPQGVYTKTCRGASEIEMSAAETNLNSPKPVIAPARCFAVGQVGAASHSRSLSRFYGGVAAFGHHRERTG